jgi:hypothetical protein
MVGGQSTHTVNVIAESAAPIRFDLVLRIEGSPAVDYAAEREDDGALVYNVPYQLSLELKKTFTPTIEHGNQANRCGKLPHRTDIAIHWGDKSGLTVPYDNPKLDGTTTFDCST